MLLYPYAGPATRVADILVRPRLTLPDGWRYASALTPAGTSGGGAAAGTVQFQAVSLEQLVDSPLIAGRYFREVPIAPDITPRHYLDMVADAPENLDITPAHVDQLSELVRQSGQLFQSRHYDAFRFLITLSDQVSGGAVDHHQSLENRRPARFLTDDSMMLRFANFIPHDLVHSWNGKYRRPLGMATPNFQVPVDSSGLWIYEGLTDYLGAVLTARAGIWSREQFLGQLAETAASFSHRPGRTWRDLQDTSSMAMRLWEKGGGAYDNWRRNGFDFYGEGGLVWLELDVTIRKLSGGTKSLDDFIALFYGAGGDSGPKVLPYTLDQLSAALNQVTPNDWGDFLQARLHSLAPEAPLGGIAGAGYRLVYRDCPNDWNAYNKGKSLLYSIGMTVNASGGVTDVLLGGAAAQAGFVPGMKILDLNGQAYGAALLQQAIHTAAGPMAFTVQDDAGRHALRLDYHGGERFPVLERVPGAPDLLGDIIKPGPHSAAPGALQRTGL